MSEFTLLVLGVIGVISAGVAGVVYVKRTKKQLQAERTVNREAQAEVLMMVALAYALFT